MTKKKKNKTTGNEEIREIMEQIKNAPKDNGTITIDTDRKLDDGTWETTHEEQECDGVDVKTVEEMKAEYPDFNPDFENANNPEKDFGLSDDERKDIEELQKEYTAKHPEKGANKGVQGVPVAKVEQHPTKHNKPAKNAPKRIEDYEPKEIPDEAMQVYNLLLAGKSEPELRVMYPKWSKRKFKAIIQRANALIAIAVKDKDAAKADVLAKFQHLYNLAYKVGNIKECSRALENIAKINGLTTNLNISDSNFIALWGNQTNVNK